jgi:hypothetical protein
MSELKTIAEILIDCEIGDKLTNDKSDWEVVDKYDEDGELIVIARPVPLDNGDEKGDYDYELWNVGSEKHSHMPNLRKI